jgi:hypothetical protein
VRTARELVPGSPERCRERAAQARRTAAELADAAARLRAVAGWTPLWTGQGASACRASLADLPRSLDTAADAFQAVGAHLDAWADRLAGLQVRARAVVAEHRALAARLPDPAAAAACAEAERRAAALWSEARSASDVVAAALRAAGTAAPATPGRLRQQVGAAADGVALLRRSPDDWVDRHGALLDGWADDLSRASTALALVALVPGVGWPVAVLAAGLALAGAGTRSLAVRGGAAEWDDVGWDVAAGVGGGAAVAASRLTVAARVADGLPLTPRGRVPSLFSGPSVGAAEGPWRIVRLHTDGVDRALTARGAATTSLPALPRRGARSHPCAKAPG